MTDLVDLGAGFADDGACESTREGEVSELAPRARRGREGEKRTDELVGDEDLLGLRSRSNSRSRRSTRRGRSTVSSSTTSSAATVISSSSTVALGSSRGPVGSVGNGSDGVLLEDGADVVDGDVDGVGDTRDGEDSLWMVEKGQRGLGERKR